MQVIWDWIVTAYENISSTTFRFWDLIDILIMAYFIYALVNLVRKTRSTQLVKGILFVLIAFMLSSPAQLDLKAVNWLIKNVMQIGLIAIIIVFQPEMRRALEQVGRSSAGAFSFFSPRSSSDSYLIWHDPLVSICNSADHMSGEKTGALIVIERNNAIDDIINTGTQLDSKVSSELLETIFYEGSPLHDGAVVIRDGRVIAAGCLLPLTAVSDISREMGTRHRAAIGMSENSDALVVVVSEETGIVSLARNGVIIRRLKTETLMKILSEELIPPEDETKRKFFIRKKKDDEQK